MAISFVALVLALAPLVEASGEGSSSPAGHATSGNVPVRCSTSTATRARAETSVERGLLEGAFGLELLSRGELDEAELCLESASVFLPDSSVLARDLASLYARRAQWTKALAWIDRAIALGDGDPEVHQLRAILLANDHRVDEATEESRRAQGWEGSLIAAALGDRAAAHDAASLIDEETPQGAIASLVLAANALAHNEQTTARLLTAIAEAEAAASSSTHVVRAAHRLERHLDEHAGPLVTARLRSTIEHATNPAYEALTGATHESGLRLGLFGEVGIQAPLDITRFDAAMRLNQHLFLTARERLRELDLTAFAIEASVELPISRSPSAALVGLRTAFSDIFADRLRVHYATTIEGGPTLTLPLTAAAMLELALCGVAVDFIDTSPADAKLSSLNRDYGGQRVVLAVLLRNERVDARADFTFLRDDALGDAFDAIGGALRARGRAHFDGGITLGAGLAVTVREFGPVGDRAIIGPAATRTEFRTTAELSLRIALGAGFAAVVQDTWLRTHARDGHAYTGNALSLGMERVW